MTWTWGLAGLFMGHGHDRTEQQGPAGGDEIRPFLMYLCLNTKQISVCSNLCSHYLTCLYHPSPDLPSTHNSDKKTWPWSRQCKSNRGEIDGSNNSGLELNIDSWAIGLEIDESGATALNFPIYSWLQRYSADSLLYKFRVKTINSWYWSDSWECWLMSVMI